MSKIISVKSQIEFDALPQVFAEYTIISVASTEIIVVHKARENSRVVARENASIYLLSADSTVTLYGFSVCFCQAGKGKVKHASKTATVIKPVAREGVAAWLEREGAQITGKSVCLYKRVSSELKTQEGTPNETVWAIGHTLTHPAWAPKQAECGPGKFHACARPYLCDEFRSVSGDRYVAIRIALADLHVWDNAPSYPHKIAFRKGKVLYEVDWMGEKVVNGNTV